MTKRVLSVKTPLAVVLRDHARQRGLALCGGALFLGGRALVAIDLDGAGRRGLDTFLGVGAGTKDWSRPRHEVREYRLRRHGLVRGHEPGAVVAGAVPVGAYSVYNRGAYANLRCNIGSVPAHA